MVEPESEEQTYQSKLICNSDNIAHFVAMDDILLNSLFLESFLMFTYLFIYELKGAHTIIQQKKFLD